MVAGSHTFQTNRGDPRFASALQPIPYPGRALRGEVKAAILARRGVENLCRICLPQQRSDGRKSGGNTLSEKLKKMRWPAQAERRVRVCEPLAPDNSTSSLPRLQFGSLCFPVRGMVISSYGRDSSDSTLGRPESRCHTSCRTSWMRRQGNETPA